MQPTGYPVDHPLLLEVWRRFLTTGRWEDAGGFAPDPAVIQSWRRCGPRFNPQSLPRITPISGRALSSILRAQQDLITVATPFIEDIHQFTEGSNCAIVLTDGAGCILVVGGDNAAVEAAAALGFQQGTYWTEDSAGTTALGMALVTAMPVQVVGAEHYFRALHDVVTTAAPIHDVRGRIISVLGTVGPALTANAHMLGLMMSAARAIGNQLQADWYLHEANRHLSEVNAILGTITEGILVWDAHGEIQHVSEQAAQMLDLQPRSVLGRELRSVFTLPPELEEALQSETELRDVEINLIVMNRPVRCLITLRPIQGAGGSPASYVALLSPIEHVRQIAQQQYGTQATIIIDDIQAESTLMRRVVRQARTAARGMAPVLISGEGGVGKNLLARAIHNDGPRAGKPFIDLNCRAIPHELMAREIIGQEKDTNTRGQPSKFELADGGTLLLDQIESLSLELQAALLYVIETKHVTRLGSSHPIPVDVRIIAATTVDLEDLVAQGSFLSHLYYRFGVFHIDVPPLRERVEDIPLLAERFLARSTRREGRAFWLQDDAIEVLHRYPWPGNVRELESVLERAMTQSHDGLIRAADLPEVVRRGRVLSGQSPRPEPVLSVTDAEREAILRAGWATRGRVSEMARLLGIGRSTLWRKMKRLSINPASFKA